MSQRFRDKASARGAVWDRLERERLAAFPFPPHGRIPNFKGAGEAARRRFDIDLFARASRIKVNPDSAQRPVRAEALRRGITVYVPTPRLRGGFMKLDPSRIAPDQVAEAATMSKCQRFAETVPLEALPQLDAIVCGSVAVTRGGRRCGKGEGYSDIEFAILAELGHRPVPVATTVHEVQLVDGFPWAPNDLPLSYIVTPVHVIEVTAPPPPPPRPTERHRLGQVERRTAPGDAGAGRTAPPARKGSRTWLSVRRATDKGRGAPYFDAPLFTRCGPLRAQRPASLPCHYAAFNRLADLAGQLCLHGREEVDQLVADCEHGGNDCHGDTRGDQAVLDGSHALLVGDELGEVRLQAKQTRLNLGDES